MNFPPHFIKIIKAFITSTSYALMTNGLPSGLRQGEPLSPLLLLIGMEYLSYILTCVDSSYRYHPRYKRINLSHLCFPDDLKIFCIGDMNFVKIVCNFLQTFPKILGLQAYSNKLVVHIACIPPKLKEMISNVTQFTASLFSPFQIL